MPQAHVENADTQQASTSLRYEPPPLDPLENTIGATSPLPRVSEKVGLPKGERLFSVGGGNASSCPTADLAVGREQRKVGVNSVTRLPHKRERAVRVNEAGRSNHQHSNGGNVLLRYGSKKLA